VVGSGEGGFKAYVQSNSCTGKRAAKGCGYIRFSLGIEVCSGLGFAGITLVEACVKGEGYWQKKWCLGEKSSSCWGLRASASFCTGWRKRSCREYVLIDSNACEDGDSGGG